MLSAVFKEHRRESGVKTRVFLLVLSARGGKGSAGIRKAVIIMTKVTIDPGICSLTTQVEASSDDQMEVHLKVRSGCPSVGKMMEDLGEVFDAYELCLAKPGADPLHKYAAAHFPGHAGCPVLAGIIKCAEVECRLALPKDAVISFETK